MRSVLSGNALFTLVGVGQWFRYVTGILELTGAVLILAPKARRIGAALLGTVMLEAAPDFARLDAAVRSFV